MKKNQPRKKKVKNRSWHPLPSGQKSFKRDKTRYQTNFTLLPQNRLLRSIIIIIIIGKKIKNGMCTIESYCLVVCIVGDSSERESTFVEVIVKRGTYPCQPKKRTVVMSGTPLWFPHLLFDEERCFKISTTVPSFYLFLCVFVE